MPWSALPEHINTPEKWKGTDWDNSWQRWLLKFKGYFAFGPRATERWAQWRSRPLVLFARRGAGDWRWESLDNSYETGDEALKIYDDLKDMYLSRIQYWCRWHFAIQWPLQVSFHWYWREADVPKYDTRPTDMSLKKMVFGYGPCHRDADGVYWLLSFYLGGVWK